MGSFEKYSACTQWVLGGQIASEITMNSPCTHWVNAPLPPVPEQCLITCMKISECPKGMVAANALGDNIRCNLRDASDIIDTLESFDPEKEPRGYAEMCKGAGIKPTVDPFWRFLPYANIYQSVTPDVLHQLHQGVVKHLIAWLQDAFGTRELDSRSRHLPPNHNVRHFSNGISNLLRISGKGKSMQRCARSFSASSSVYPSKTGHHQLGYSLPHVPSWIFFTTLSYRCMTIQRLEG